MTRAFFSAVAVLSVLWIPGVEALKSDRDQPALIEADEVEMDFSSGRRIYRGNVSVKQGTIRIIANEIELFYDGEQLDKAIAKGNPAVFRQRPDNKPHDVIGQGLTIELDEIRNVVTFIQEAKVRQGGDAISGETIEYDMGEDKMKVRGDTVTTRAPQNKAVSTDSSTLGTEQDNSSRARIVIKPRKDQGTENSTAKAAGDLAKVKDDTAGQSSTSPFHPTDETPFRAAYVRKGGARVHATRSQTSAVIGRLSPGDPVKVVASDGGWFKVNTPLGVAVWIYGQFVTSVSGPGRVSGDNVRLRSVPSTGKDSVVVGTLNRGTAVRVLQVKGDWKKIRPPINLGFWVPASRIDPLVDANPDWLADWQANLTRFGATGE